MLTEEQVRAIRSAWRPRPSLAQLSKQYGIAKSAIQKILNFETYKDIRA
jgi:predicted DNA binding protein